MPNAYPISNAAGNSSAAWLPGLVRLLTRKACFVALGLAAMGLPSGCVAVIAGTGAGAAVAYSAGKLQTDLSADLERTEQATRNAITQLQFAAISENTDALNGIFIARTATDTKVKVELTKVGDHVTHVKIRAGIFGDEQISLATLDKIKSNLGI